MDKALEYRNNQIGNLCKALTGMVLALTFCGVGYGIVSTIMWVATM